MDPIPAEGDFSFVTDETERMVYEDLYLAWPLLDKEPGNGSESGGFHFNVKPYQAIYTILFKIDRDGHAMNHTGASLASADDCVSCRF